MTKEEKIILIVCNSDFIYEELEKLTITGYMEHRNENAR